MQRDNLLPKSVSIRITENEGKQNKTKNKKQTNKQTNKQKQKQKKQKQKKTRFRTSSHFALYL